MSQDPTLANITEVLHPSNSRGIWIVPVGQIRVVLSLGRFTRGTTPSNGRGRAGPG